MIYEVRCVSDGRIMSARLIPSIRDEKEYPGDRPLHAEHNDTIKTFVERHNNLELYKASWGYCYGYQSKRSHYYVYMPNSNCLVDACDVVGRIVSHGGSVKQ